MPEASHRTEGLAERAVLDLQDGQAHPRQDQLAEEVPVALHYDDAPYAVMMASPGDLEDFAVGFSLTELGLGPGDLLGIEVRPELEGWRISLRTGQAGHRRQSTGTRLARYQLSPAVSRPGRARSRRQCSRRWMAPP